MPISDELIRQIRANDQQLTSVNLSRIHPPLSVEDMRQLMQALHDNTYVTTLVFCESELDDPCVDILATSLQNLPHITTLDVSVNDIGEETAKKLFSLPYLTSLDISANPRITDQAGKLLLNNRSLCDADLEGTGITPDVQTQIQAHLQQNESRVKEGLKLAIVSMVDGLSLAQLVDARNAIQHACGQPQHRDTASTMTSPGFGRA